MWKGSLNRILWRIILKEEETEKWNLTRQRELLNLFAKNQHHTYLFLTVFSLFTFLEFPSYLVRVMSNDWTPGRKKIFFQFTTIIYVWGREHSGGQKTTFWGWFFSSIFYISFWDWGQASRLCGKCISFWRCFIMVK